MSTTTPNFGWVVPTSSDLVKNGAVAIETLGDSIDASMVDLKGGTTGQVLSKTSNTDMDFTWTTASSGSGYVAGKNKMINGDFGIWQRGISFSSMGFAAYTADRYQNAQANTLAVTASRESFTAGTAPVAGYESAYFHRTVVPANSGSADYAQLNQKVEDVRTLAGQQVTLSFWAKAASGTPKIAIEVSQNFGSGGSPSATVDTYISQITTSTSWARYSATFTMPSISGKTVGTTANSSFTVIQLWYTAGSSLNARTGSLGNQANTFDVWGWQLEGASTASYFATASGGSQQAELAMCQRYYFRSTPGNSFGNYGLGIAGSATNAYVSLKTPVSMRVVPTSIDVPSTITQLKLTNVAATNYTISAIAIGDCTQDNLMLNITSSSMTANQGLILGNNNNTSGFIGASAEL